MATTALPREEITVRESALRLGVLIPYAYTLLWSNRLHGRKVGKRWLIDVESVEARIKATKK
jgi:excisionase family DNA binding protein